MFLIKNKRVLWTIAILAFAGTVCIWHFSAVSRPVDTVIKISGKVNPRPYNRMIFGGFIEHFNHQVYGGIFEPGSPLADEQGFREDVIDALKELKMPVIRWPGGCFVDGYHWMDGIGEKRVPKDDVRWGTLEPNTFGTGEFVEFCRRLGAEPYICHNGLAEVQEMVDWVAYCNSDKGRFADLRKTNGDIEPYAVKYWSVGNERSGRAYVEKVRDGAKAMKESDPSIAVTCSGAHSNPKVDDYLFETAGKYLDYISIHQYWIRNFQKIQKPDYMTCILLSDLPDKFIDDVIKALDRNGMRGKIKLAFDEWNLRSWHHPGFPKGRKVDYRDEKIKKLVAERNRSLDNSLYTMADALFAASFLNACLRHPDDVQMANIAPAVNQTGPLYVDEKGVVRRPHFYTMRMYANLLEKYVAPVEIISDSVSDGKKSIPSVDALATADLNEGKWVLSMVNRDPEHSKICALRIGDNAVRGKFKAYILSGDSPDAYNDAENPGRVAPEEKTVAVRRGILELPPHSLVLLVIE